MIIELPISNKYNKSNFIWVLLKKEIKEFKQYAEQTSFSIAGIYYSFDEYSKARKKYENEADGSIEYGLIRLTKNGEYYDMLGTHTEAIIGTSTTLFDGTISNRLFDEDD